MLPFSSIIPGGFSASRSAGRQHFYKWQNKLDGRFATALSPGQLESGSTGPYHRDLRCHLNPCAFRQRSRTAARAQLACKASAECVSSQLGQPLSPLLLRGQDESIQRGGFWSVPHPREQPPEIRVKLGCRPRDSSRPWHPRSLHESGRPFSVRSGDLHDAPFVARCAVSRGRAVGEIRFHCTPFFGGAPQLIYLCEMRLFLSALSAAEGSDGSWQEAR